MIHIDYDLVGLNSGNGLILVRVIYCLSLLRGGKSQVWLEFDKSLNKFVPLHPNLILLNCEVVRQIIPHVSSGSSG